MIMCSKLTKTSFIGTSVFLFCIFLSFQVFASEDDIIRQRIADEVVKHATLSNKQVFIHVEDGFVLLTGFVRLYIQKIDIEQISWKTKGVTEVENAIKVKPLFPPTDNSIARKVRMILLDCECFHGGKYIVTVGEGVVSVSGVFFQPRDVQFLKHQIAKIEGVVNIHIHVTAMLAAKPELEGE